MRKIILIMGFFALACNNSSEKKTYTKDTTKQTVQMPATGIPDTVFTGFGTDYHYWWVYIIKNDKIVFDADATMIEVPFVEAIHPDAVTTVYRSSANGNTVDLIISRQDCSDGFNKEIYHYDVTVLINKARFHGCGRFGK